MSFFKPIFTLLVFTSMQLNAAVLVVPAELITLEAVKLGKSHAVEFKAHGPDQVAIHHKEAKVLKAVAKAIFPKN